MSRSLVFKWLYVGLHVKRWLFLLLLGVVLMGLGFAYLLREVYVSYTFPEWVGTATLQFLPRWARGALFISVASVLSVLAVWKLNRSMITAVLPRDQQDQVVDLIYQARTQQRGPRIVAIGGGTGLSNLLRGLKQYTSNLTAIVTVADDGGSSGALRRDMGVIPPGDIRNCIAALADSEPLVRDLFQYRFDDRSGNGLEGHAFGNLFIVAMSRVTGSMEEAIRETSRVLRVRGRIVPATLSDVALVARMDDGTVIRGESSIGHAGRTIAEVSVDPPNAPVNAEVVAALRDADLVVIGPGSLYTSVLPNLLVRGLTEALLASPGYKVFISNVASEHGETDGMSAADHYQALRRHLGGREFADVILANSNLPGEPLPGEWQSQPVSAPGDADYGRARLVLADIVDHEVRYRHDTERLAAHVMRLYFERDLRRIESRVLPPATPVR
ncbi:MAG: YvcK family protein [Dehalococcoidia bacterium]|nr:YvcK family protein [Dehalococcoidia bacterium]